MKHHAKHYAVAVAAFLSAAMVANCRIPSNGHKVGVVNPGGPDNPLFTSVTVNGAPGVFSGSGCVTLVGGGQLCGDQLGGVTLNGVELGGEYSDAGETVSTLYVLNNATVDGGLSVGNGVYSGTTGIFDGGYISVGENATLTMGTYAAFGAPLAALWPVPISSLTGLNYMIAGGASFKTDVNAPAGFYVDLQVGATDQLVVQTGGSIENFNFGIDGGLTVANGITSNGTTVGVGNVTDLAGLFVDGGLYVAENVGIDGGLIVAGVITAPGGISLANGSINNATNIAASNSVTATTNGILGDVLLQSDSIEPQTASRWLTLNAFANNGQILAGPTIFDGGPLTVVGPEVGLGTNSWDAGSFASLSLGSASGNQVPTLSGLDGGAPPATPVFVEAGTVNFTTATTATTAFKRTFTNAPFCVCSLGIETSGTVGPQKCGSSTTTFTLTMAASSSGSAEFICVGQ